MAVLGAAEVDDMRPDGGAAQAGADIDSVAVGVLALPPVSA